MIKVDEEYTEERECIYKGRHYRVRNNGAVMRVPSPDKRVTKYDNVWTFGNKDANGYLSIAGVRIHTIVAKAFLGERPGELVIDHIDTIKTNNRPSNLRYVTRFENLVGNPLTRGKIEQLTGLPIEEVLKDMTILHNLNLPPKFSWVKGISQKEADHIRMELSQLISKPITKKENAPGNNSKTEYAIQAGGWYPRGFFPFCPQHEDSSLEEYASNIVIGKPFFFHHDNKYLVDGFGLSNDRKTLAVKCSDLLAPKQNILITVTYNSRKWFIHTCNRYFAEESLEKYYTLAIGREWTGGDVFDDYC